LEFISIIEENIFFRTGLIVLCSYLSFLVAKIVILKPLNSWFIKTKTSFDDIFFESGFFNRLIYLVPLLILYNLESAVSQYSTLVNRILNSIFVIILFMSVQTLLTTFGEVYGKSRFSERMHIKGYIQVAKLVLGLIGILGVVTVLTGQSPVYLLSGIGALTAVLLVVFKDTILSFVATVQINSNNLFKIGDWVEAPQFGADGDVVDIALHTVKIQNWDKTITVIPTHKLIESSFKNWRGMTDSGGRRIKRAIHIDVSSIRFCDELLLRRFEKYNIIQAYINSKIADVDETNEQSNANLEELINGRRLTNIGTFRAYIKSYLRNHKSIHKDMTFLIRQLPPTEKGLPIEIYVFTNDTNWIKYESIQADIFDHLLAVVPEFDLRVFQIPAGSDMKKIIGGL